MNSGWHHPPSKKVGPLRTIFDFGVAGTMSSASRERSTNVNLRTAFVVSLVLSTPLFAQVEEPQPAAQIAPRLEEAATRASEPAAKLRLITEAVTQNFIPKYADGAGALTN